MSEIISKEDRLKVATLLENGIEASKKRIPKEDIKGLKKSLEDIKQGRLYE